MDDAAAPSSGSIQLARLGKTDVLVSRLGLGTVPFGGLYAKVAEEDVLDVVRETWDAGARFFDTAPVYGMGMAEVRLGMVLPHLDRDSFVIATKVGRLLRPDAPPDPVLIDPDGPRFRSALPMNPVFDFSYDGAMRSLEESLLRLNLDRVDIVHIHDPDDRYEEALRGAYIALESLRRAGTIRAVGVGMTQSAMLARFVRETDIDCVLLAGRYTLLDQSAAYDLLPACLDRGVSVIAGGVFNSGILADPTVPSTYDYLPAEPTIVERAQRLRSICEAHGVSLAAAAIQFALGHPAVASVIVGVRSVTELRTNLSAAAATIPQDMWHELVHSGLLPRDVPVPPAASVVL
jgi:D-threo-aldose 1-dehydrogenase